jgi:hypothetical protein
MSGETLVVRFGLDVLVDLPEEQVATESGNVTESARERAIEAALSAMNSKDVYLDGVNSDPAKVTFDVSDSDVEGVYF